MSGWAKKSFEELRDVCPPEIPMQWRFARDAVGAEEIGVSRFTYEPGARMPWGHRHREQEEVYVVLAGSGRARLDEEMICVGGRRPPGGDTEKFPDFWR